MSEPSKSRWIFLALGILALLAWVVVDFVPEWFPSDGRTREGQARLNDRLGYEQRYGAGWLTAHYREHGELPESLPPNRAAAGNGAVIELCPERPEDLVSDQADWALCPQDRAVRALARHRDMVVGMGEPEKVELFPP